MSTLLGQAHNSVIQSESDLAHYFQGFSKSPQNLKVGLEAEFLGIHLPSGAAIPYEGKAGICEIFKLLIREFQYQPVLDHGNIIALTRGDTVIALEPGGQVELSAPPASDIFEIEHQINQFVPELRFVEKKMPEVRWLAAGIQPFSRLEDIAWVPKHRYRILADYAKEHGSLSHHMMKRTATNQFNFDYTSETDALFKLRVMLTISSVVSAMFANASFSEGRQNGYASYRLEIWNHTTPERAGLIPQFMEKGKTFRDYLEYILTIPLIFIVRGGEWIPVKNKNFREFIRDGFQGTKPTVGDFELHLSTAFPEARIKQYLEVRGIDGQSLDLIPAVAAFWKGILYSEDAGRKALELFAFASPEDQQRLHLEVPRKGLQSQLSGRPVLPLAEQLLEISRQGLLNQEKESAVKGEVSFLSRIQESILKPGQSPGEKLAREWNHKAISPEAAAQRLKL